MAPDNEYYLCLASDISNRQVIRAPGINERISDIYWESTFRRISPVSLPPLIGQMLTMIASDWLLNAKLKCGNNKTVRDALFQD